MDPVPSVTTTITTSDPKKLPFVFDPSLDRRRITKIEHKHQKTDAITIFKNCPRAAHATNGIINIPNDNYNQDKNHTLNRWTGIQLPFRLVKDYKDWKLTGVWINFIRYVYMSPGRNENNTLNPDEVERCLHWFLTYLASIVQRPHKKFDLLVLFCGRMGMGKTFIFYLLQRILGPILCILLNGEKDLTGDFTDPRIADAILVYLDELRVQSEESYEDLKTKIRNDILRMRLMFTNVANPPNYINFMGSSNYDNPIPQIKGNERTLVTLYTYLDPFKCHPDILGSGNSPFKYYLHGILEDTFGSGFNPTDPEVKRFVNDRDKMNKLFFSWIMDSLLEGKPEVRGDVTKRLRRIKKDEGLRTFVNFLYRYPLPKNNNYLKEQFCTPHYYMLIKESLEIEKVWMLHNFKEIFVNNDIALPDIVIIAEWLVRWIEHVEVKGNKELKKMYSNYRYNTSSTNYGFDFNVTKNWWLRMIEPFIKNVGFFSKKVDVFDDSSLAKWKMPDNRKGYAFTELNWNYRVITAEEVSKVDKKNIPKIVTASKVKTDSNEISTFRTKSFIILCDLYEGIIPGIRPYMNYTRDNLENDRKNLLANIPKGFTLEHYWPKYCPVSYDNLKNCNPNFISIEPVKKLNHNSVLSFHMHNDHAQPALLEEIKDWSNIDLNNIIEEAKSNVVIQVDAMETNNTVATTLSDNTISINMKEPFNKIDKGWQYKDIIYYEKPEKGWYRNLKLPQNILWNYYKCMDCNKSNVLTIKHQIPFGGIEGAYYYKAICLNKNCSEKSPHQIFVAYYLDQKKDYFTKLVDGTDANWMQLCKEEISAEINRN